jgi:hypothetical protein
MDNEHGELALELGVPSRTPTTGPTRRARSLEMPPAADASQRQLASILAPPGGDSLGTSSNARQVSARLRRDLAFPRYFVRRCAYVTRLNDAFNYNGRE